MRQVGVAASALMLSGCVCLRAGGGLNAAPHRPADEHAAVTPEAEIGVIMPITDDGRLAGSVLSVIRHHVHQQDRPLLGLEVVQAPEDWLQRARSGARPDGKAEVGSEPERKPPFLPLLGGRLEVGHDDLGRYAGGAFVARAITPFSLELVLSAGAYLGHGGGPAAGLHLLGGFL